MSGFGDILHLTYENSYLELYDSIEIEVFGIPLKNLCHEYHNALIKNIGYDFTIETSEGVLLIDSFKYNRVSAWDRTQLDCYLERTNEKRLGCWKLPLFPEGFISSKTYLENFDNIQSFRIDLNIELCNLDDILITYNNEGLNLNDVKLKYRLCNQPDIDAYNRDRVIMLRTNNSLYRDGQPFAQLLDIPTD